MTEDEVDKIIGADFSEKFSRDLNRYRIAEEDEYRKWTELIPFIKWPADWEVKAIPPFGGAIVRYLIKTPKCKRVSVYLDCYQRLGFMSAPYWEVYPHEGDCARCYLNEAEELVRLISECADEKESDARTL